MRKELFLLADAKVADRDKVFINFKDLTFRLKTWEALSVTNDPQIFLYDNLDEPLNSLRYRFVKFSLFVDETTIGQLSWWLSDGRWQTSCNIIFMKGWHNYCFDMKTIPTPGKFAGLGIGWEGLISRLRLDPTEVEGTRIKIRSAGCAFLPRGKLTYVLSIGALADGQFKQDADANFQANYEDCKSLALTVKSKPMLIYAEISTKCNLRCRMCGRYSYKIPLSHQGFMNKKVFSKLSKLFSPGARLALFGRGESLLHPDFIDFLNIAHNRNISVGFNTNGLLLTPKIARAMVEYRQAQLTFSCSAGSPETYHIIHGTNGWDKLWDKIDMLNKIKTEYKLLYGDVGISSVFPYVYIEFVSQLSNISELPELLRRAFTYNLSGLMVIDLVAHSNAMEKERMNTPENMALAEKYYKEASSVFKKMISTKYKDFDFRLPDSYSVLSKKFISSSDEQMLSEIKKTSVNSPVFASDNFCIEPWRTFYVRFDGTVAPCCITGRQLGDLNKNTAEEIWNGAIYQKFRARMKGKYRPYECLHCHFSPGSKRYDVSLGKQENYEEL